MKKRLVLLMTVSMLLLAACGSSEKVIGGDTTANNGQNTGSDAQTGGENVETHKGYVFTYNGTVVEVDADAAPIVAALGEPVSYFEAASCAFEGLDKMYTYSGFEIDTYPVEEKDYVSAIIFKDDSVATDKGVSIGNSFQRVKDLYGTDYTENNGMITYEKDGMKLCFIIQDDAVVSIEYLSTVLEQ